MDKSNCMVVVGAQWGDEGKGKIVDVLAAQVSVIARYQGGANAGHTVHVGGNEFILHQIPSGILHDGTRCLLGNGVVLDLEQFFEELDEIHARGVQVDGRVGVSGRAHLLLDYHKKLDKAREVKLGSAKIGTTGRGIGPCYEDKIARQGVRAGDLMNEERARKKLVAACERANERLRQENAELVDVEQVVARILELAVRLRPLVAETGREVMQSLKAGKSVLLEGAQGALLDVDHGTYPFVTSSTTTAGGAATGVGIGPTAIGSVLGVVKAYTTRVGSGPLPTEIAGELGEHLRKLGGEYGATTGRPRRCGWFDSVVTRYSARVNGLTGLAVTKLDVLDTFDEIQIATGYDIQGHRFDSVFPYDLSLLEEAKPFYETLPGWKATTSTARSIADLPKAARAYLDRMEALTEVPIAFVSVGTRRDQIIEV
jgi:adenylosuccinate synthase